PDAPDTAWAAAERARHAAERARESAEEAADRPEHALASLTAPSRSFFEGFSQRVRAHAAYNRGRSHYEANHYREAHAGLSEAVALDPAHDDARALLAWTDYGLGQYRAAIGGFKAAIRRQPTWEGLYDGLGWSRLRLGRAYLARDAFRAALDRRADYADAQ